MWFRLEFYKNINLNPKDSFMIIIETFKKNCFIISFVIILIIIYAIIYCVNFKIKHISSKNNIYIKLLYIYIRYYIYK